MSKVVTTRIASSFLIVSFLSSSFSMRESCLGGSLHSIDATCTCPAMLVWINRRASLSAASRQAFRFARGECDSCTASEETVLSSLLKPEWRNWYTHQTQNLARSNSCRFESDLRHHHPQYSLIINLSFSLNFGRRILGSSYFDRCAEDKRLDPAGPSVVLPAIIKRHLNSQVRRARADNL
jgi:hypothetical protein